MEIKVFNELKETINTNKRALTTNTVTALNGNIDISIYSDAIIANPIETKKLLEEIYGNKATYIYMVLCSEIYYQKNDCYKALVQAIATISVLQANEDYDLLFVALYIQMCVMIVTGQVKAIYPMIEGMDSWVKKSGNETLARNHRALGAWCALYDDDWYVIDEWMNNSAPNEYMELDLEDVFSLFVKGRIYYARQKNIALISLLECVKPLLEINNREMYMCELNILYALACFAQGEKEDAFEKIDLAIDSAMIYGYDRLIADEGEAIYKLLSEYLNWVDSSKQKKQYIKNILKLAKEMALMHPRYLRAHTLDYPRLTKSEMEVLRLMADDRTNSDISEFLGITINTVKYHSKNIYKKLGVKNRHLAVRVAKEEGYF